MFSSKPLPSELSSFFSRVALLPLKLLLLLTVLLFAGAAIIESHTFPPDLRATTVISNTDKSSLAICSAYSVICTERAQWRRMLWRSRITGTGWRSFLLSAHCGAIFAFGRRVLLALNLTVTYIAGEKVPFSWNVTMCRHSWHQRHTRKTN